MLEKLKNKLSQGVAAVTVKSESLVETTRTKANISTKQKESDALQLALGSKVYAAWKQGSVTIDMFTEDLNAISAIEAEIEHGLYVFQKIRVCVGKSSAHVVILSTPFLYKFLKFRNDFFPTTIAFVIYAITVVNFFSTV